MTRHVSSSAPGQQVHSRALVGDGPFPPPTTERVLAPAARHRRAAILPTAGEQVPLPRRTGRRRRYPLPAQRLQVAPAERLIWVSATADEVRNAGTTAAGDRFLIGSYDARLHAIGLDGTPAWQFTAGRGICSTPAGWRDSLIVGAEDGAVYGLALADGRLKWRYRTSMAVRSSPRSPMTAISLSVPTIASSTTSRRRTARCSGAIAPTGRCVLRRR